MERTNTPKGWIFLIASKEKTYLHVSKPMDIPRDELDGEIMNWIHRNKKLTI